MDILLNSVEARVLGSLIEKEITTPDYYPLTLNALTSACNQKSNRDPVMTLDEKTVVRGLDSLREKQMAWQVRTAGTRTPKYEHNLANRFKFSPPEIALVCVLLLRGPQTMGELRGRTGRLHKFDDLAQIEETLQGLMEREDGPFVVRLPRQVGRKERRYAHIFCGEVEVDQEDEFPPEPARRDILAEDERIAELERKVAELRMVYRTKSYGVGSTWADENFRFQGGFPTAIRPGTVPCRGPGWDRWPSSGTGREQEWDRSEMIQKADFHQPRFYPP